MSQIDRILYTFAADALADVPEVEFVDALKEVLRDRYPGAEITLVSRPTGYSRVEVFTDDPEFDPADVEADIRYVADEVFRALCGAQ
jgi:hypothetical protein